MLENISGFFQVVPVAYWIAIGIFILLVPVIVIIYKRWKKKKPAQTPREGPIDMTEESISPIVEVMPVKQAAIIEQEAPAQPQTAADVPLKSDSTASVTKYEGEIIKVGAECKYRAVIKWYPKPGRTPIIEFNNKIEKPMGGLYFLEPSCPVTGEAYFIQQHADGSFSPYDPRGDAILSKNTPYLAWDATHWERAEGVWGKKAKNWFEGNVGNIVLFGVVFMTFILALVKISG